MQFHKNLSLTGWEEVKNRQLQRLPLIEEWINFVQMESGHSVLDIGPGPGVFTLRYAEVVGTSGQVTALEKSEEAIEYLLKTLSLSHKRNVEVIMGDAEEVALEGKGPFDIILLTDILHHTESPTKILKNVYENIHSQDSRILISEFDPESDGLIGPPLEKRLSEAHLLDSLRDIGFKVISNGKQLLEHYYIIAHK